MEIDTNSTSLATLALPVIDGGYAPGFGEFCHQTYGQCPREFHLAKPRAARCKQWLTVRWQRAPAEPRCDLREMS